MSRKFITIIAEVFDLLLLYKVCKYVATDSDCRCCMHMRLEYFYKIKKIK